MPKNENSLDSLCKAWKSTSSELVSRADANGYWKGELSSSALSTATAVVTVKLASEAGLIDSELADSVGNRGLQWLTENTNPDGGWGDTNKSHSNISTTTLCWAAFGAYPNQEHQFKKIILRCERWIGEKCDGLSPSNIAKTIISRYGKDRTFSIPILTMCALSGRLGKGPKAWKHIIALPFELAALPHSWFAAFRLPVVSYALPALIAIGLVHHIKAPSLWPWVRMLRSLVIKKVMQKLEDIQPSNGGFLEATPLTSFVTMSLIAAGFEKSQVVEKGLEFIFNSQRGDGSWAIDTNLSTWVTTLSIHSLYSSEQSKTKEPEFLPNDLKLRIADWLFDQQFRLIHPYTQASPGGWAWTPLPGGVPDADDTPSAIIALCLIADDDDRFKSSIRQGCQWLKDLQNGDGGIPTFCKGWGKLPFDKSSPDLTAHTIRAWLLAYPYLESEFSVELARSLQKGIKYLLNSQNKDGSWTPLWFGNQWRPDEANPIYGTSKVLLALAAVMKSEFKDFAQLERALTNSIKYLLDCQNMDGSWGNANVHSGSIEESALVVEALSILRHSLADSQLWKNEWDKVIFNGINFLTNQVESGKWVTPYPIGFYFARLWYYEELYPVIMTTAALRTSAMSFCETD